MWNVVCFDVQTHSRSWERGKGHPGTGSCTLWDPSDDNRHNKLAYEAKNIFIDTVMCKKWESSHPAGSRSQSLQHRLFAPV